MPSASEAAPPLIVGDEKKLQVTITKGQGPPRAPWGPDGKGKPRYVQVDQAGQRVQGFVTIGRRVEGVQKLELIIHAESMRTMFIGAHPAVMESNTILKKRFVLTPSSESLDSSQSSSTPADDILDPLATSNLTGSTIKDKGKEKANGPGTLAAGTVFPFDIEFPRMCMNNPTTGAFEPDSDDEEEPTSPTSPTYDPDAKRSPFARAFGSTSGEGSSPSRRPSFTASLAPWRSNSFSAPSDGSSALSSSPTMPAINLARVGSTDSTTSNGKAIPVKMKPRRQSSAFSFSPGSSFSAMGGLLGRTTSNTPTADGPDLRGRSDSVSGMSAQAGELSGPQRSISVGSDLTIGRDGQPARAEAKKFPLPPSCNMLIGTIQVEVHYEIKIKLKRKGWRLNDVCVVRCMYFPKSRLPYERIPFQPRHPGWQTVHLLGGKAKDLSALLGKGKNRDMASEGGAKPGIMADIFLPSPLVVNIPRATAQETEDPPTIPFRLHFSSTLPYPLLTFASTEASTWRITLVRETTLTIHAKEEVRSTILRGSWSLARDPHSLFAVGSPANAPTSAINGGSGMPTNHSQPGGLSLDLGDEAPAYDAEPSSISLASPPMPYEAVARLRLDESEGTAAVPDRPDSRASGRSSDEVHMFEADLEPEPTQSSGIVGANPATPSAAEAVSAPGPAYARRTQVDDMFFTDDFDEGWGGQGAGGMDTPPPEFTSTYVPSLATMPPPPPPPVPAASIAPMSPVSPTTPGAPLPMDTEEHIYLDGSFTMFRASYKAIFQPFESREIKIKYWLNVSVEPKPGAVAEAFEGVSGRIEAFVVRAGRSE